MVRRTSLWLLAAAVALALWIGCAKGEHFTRAVYVDSGAPAFLGDGPALVTVSPNGDGYRDAAFVHYAVGAAMVVRFEVRRHGAVPELLGSPRRVTAGDHVFR